MDEEVMDLVQPEEEAAGVSAAEEAVLEDEGSGAENAVVGEAGTGDLCGAGDGCEAPKGARGAESGNADAAGGGTVVRKNGGAGTSGMVAQQGNGTEAQPGTRDYRAEAAELLERFPQARQGTLPEEVVQDAVERGMSLAAAYEAYEARSLRAELESLRKENAALKQAAESAARAPVRAVSAGGGTDTEPDDFLKGFEGEE